MRKRKGAQKTKSRKGIEFFSFCFLFSGPERGVVKKHIVHALVAKDVRVPEGGAQALLALALAANALVA